MSARSLMSPTRRTGGISSVVVGCLLLIDVSLLIYTLVRNTVTGRGDLPAALYLLPVIHLVLALALSGLLVALGGRVGRVGRLGLYTALAGTLIFAAFGFHIWANRFGLGLRWPPSGSLWGAYELFAGPLLFLVGLGLFGLAAWRQQHVGGESDMTGSWWLLAGSMVTLLTSVAPVLLLLLATVGLLDTDRGGFFAVLLVPLLFFVPFLYPLGALLLGVGFARLGQALLRENDGGET